MKRNIGVAIAIPRPFADELEGWRERFGDPAAHTIQAHVTLLPPTQIRGIEEVADHLDAVAQRHRAFPVQLRGTGTFRPVSPVVYVRVAEGAEQIVTLESDVRSGPLKRSLRFDYHPHVTVAQDVPEPTLVVAQRTLADYEATFTADAITLYEMGSGGVWGPLRDFELA
ncbi:MAG TPA: 2'-5' RNA ligase family protein [Actinomycetota bacterium]|nr:2'-5' RNA ligase family protein [Actinomycetota bacterium]